MASKKQIGSYGIGVPGFPETWQQRINKDVPLAAEGLGPRFIQPLTITNNRNARAKLPTPSSQPQTNPFGMWGQKLGGKKGIPLDLGVSLAGMLAESIAPNEWGGRMGGKLASLGGSVYGQRMTYERNAPERDLRRRYLNAQITNAERNPLDLYKAKFAMNAPERESIERLRAAQTAKAERDPLDTFFEKRAATAQERDLTRQLKQRQLDAYDNPSAQTNLNLSQKLRVNRDALGYVKEGIENFKKNNMGRELSKIDILLEENRLRAEAKKTLNPFNEPDPKSKEMIGHIAIQGKTVYYNAARQLFLDPYGKNPFMEDINADYQYGIKHTPKNEVPTQGFRIDKNTGTFSRYK